MKSDEKNGGSDFERGAGDSRTFFPAVHGPASRTVLLSVGCMQKAGGLVNTMSQLSPGEKKLDDELVAKGDLQAAQGLGQVALPRIGTGEVTLKNGRTFEPGKTEITAANIRELFSQTIVDPSGQAGQAFEALASYLDGRKASAA
ncbi:MAG: hypothetical protein EOP36_20570 [Rubrivivax sp.]|nr:MAG: hypothetical protein EOP36_20570 [Rubrivivax sp.]